MTRHFIYSCMTLPAPGGIFYTCLFFLFPFQGNKKKQNLAHHSFTTHYKYARQNYRKQNQSKWKQNTEQQEQISVTGTYNRGLPFRGIGGKFSTIPI